MSISINALSVGTKLRKGKYQITQQLGAGGFGITYLAKEKENNEIVVLKEFFMSEGFVRKGSSVITGEAGNRIMQKSEKLFKQEAEVAKKFAWHPNIVKIYELFPENNTWYFVLKYAKDGNLQEYANKKGGKLSIYEGMEVVRQAGIALLAMHNENITHRDIKPANIVKDNETFILIDFGIAKDDSVESDHTSSLVAGSKGYAPPEQSDKNAERGFYSDVYALGATAYFLLTGTTPADAQTRQNAFINQDKDPLIAPKDLNATIPTHVSDAICKAMRLRKQERYQSIKEMFADMQLSTDMPAPIYNDKYETTIIDANTSETKQDTAYSTQPTYA